MLNRKFGRGLNDGVDHLAEIGLAHREATLGHHAAGGRKPLPQDAVVFPGSDIVRAPRPGKRGSPGKRRVVVSQSTSWLTR